MLEQILNLLKIAGILLLVTAIWLISIAVVYRDINRRRLHSVEQFLWLAAVTLLPLVGFLIYWVARLLTRLLLPENALQEEDPRLRLTAVKRSEGPPAPSPSPARRLPTIGAEEAAGVKRTVPMLDPWEEPAATSKSAPAVQYTLVALEGPYLGSKFPLPSFPARLGRGSSVAVQLNADQGVSRQHAEVYVDATHGVQIRDLNSTHGTFVNGQRIQNAQLSPGDRVTVGLSTLLFTDVQG